MKAFQLVLIVFIWMGGFSTYADRVNGESWDTIKGLAKSNLKKEGGGWKYSWGQTAEITKALEDTANTIYLAGFFTSTEERDNFETFMGNAYSEVSSLSGRNTYNRFNQLINRIEGRLRSINRSSSLECIKEGELIASNTVNSCCPGLKRSSIRNNVNSAAESGVSCQKVDLFCSKNSDCCSGACMAGVCDDIRVCEKIHPDFVQGVSCETDDQCGDGLKCLEVDLSMYGTIDMKGFMEACQNDGECSSGKCDSGNCVLNYQCKTPCKGVSESVSGSQICCAGLKKDEADNVCVLDIADEDINFSSANEHTDKSFLKGAPNLTVKGGSSFEACQVDLWKDRLRDLHERPDTLSYKIELALLSLEFVSSGKDGYDDHWKDEEGKSINQRIRELVKDRKENRDKLRLNLQLDPVDFKELVKLKDNLNAAKSQQRIKDILGDDYMGPEKLKVWLEESASLQNRRAKMECTCLTAKGYENLENEGKERYRRICPDRYAKYQEEKAAKKLELEGNYNGDVFGLKHAEALKEFLTLKKEFELEIAKNESLSKEKIEKLLNYLEQTNWHEGEIVQSTSPYYSFGFKKYCLFFSIFEFGGVGKSRGYTEYHQDMNANKNVTDIYRVTEALWTDEVKPRVWEDLERGRCRFHRRKFKLKRHLDWVKNKTCNGGFVASSCVKHFSIVDVGKSEEVLVDPWIPYGLRKEDLFPAGEREYSSILKKEISDLRTYILNDRSGKVRKKTGINLSSGGYYPRFVPQGLKYDFRKHYLIDKKRKKKIIDAAKEFVIQAGYLDKGSQDEEIQRWAEYTYEYHFLYPKLSDSGKIAYPQTGMLTYLKVLKEAVEHLENDHNNLANGGGGHPGFEDAISILDEQMNKLKEIEYNDEYSGATTDRSKDQEKNNGSGIDLGAIDGGLGGIGNGAGGQVGTLGENVLKAQEGSAGDTGTASVGGSAGGSAGAINNRNGAGKLTNKRSGKDGKSEKGSSGSGIGNSRFRSMTNAILDPLGGKSLKSALSGKFANSGPAFNKLDGSSNRSGKVGSGSLGSNGVINGKEGDKNAKKNLLKFGKKGGFKKGSGRSSKDEFWGDLGAYGSSSSLSNNGRNGSRSGSANGEGVVDEDARKLAEAIRSKKGNNKKYKRTEGLSLWQIVTNTYIRVYDRLLERAQ